MANSSGGGGGSSIGGTSCATNFVVTFFENIDKIIFLPLVVRPTITAYQTYVRNLPKNNLSDVAVELEDCAANSLKGSLSKSITSVFVFVIALIITVILVVIAVMAYVSGGYNSSLNTFLIFFLAVVVVAFIYACYVITNNRTQTIDIGPCITNASTSVSIYELQIQRAIASGLCAF